MKLLSILVFIFLSSCTTVPDLGISNGELTQCPDKPNCVSSYAPEDDEKHYVDSYTIKGNAKGLLEKPFESIKAAK